ncbi:MAG: DNA replication/repair protein RecF [Gammaproteobacteria bacterium]|nr:DNA replication/repair protein RecF [Gammaproteobacteria bacterium]
MSITSLKIVSFRNITNASLDCSSRFNLFFGDNAAGKTSVLEAIYYLSSGKSFRTRHHDRVVQYSQNQLTIFALMKSDNGEIPIGLHRAMNGTFQVRINEETIYSVAEISRYLPVQFIGSDSHRILSDGPKCRRQFLDWGLFHTNPLFYSQWKMFQKSLMLRNAALKARASRDELHIWNHEFSVVGEALNASRQAYAAEFAPIFQEIMRVLLNDITVDLLYSPGWDVSISLETCLNQNVSRETFVGHSLFGPHRADLAISVGGVPAEDVLSQGQQKLVSYALRLAQGIHLQSSAGKTPIYLIDDLPAELDPYKRHLVTEILSTIRAQVFITGIESSDLNEILALHRDNKMFHVKHGVVCSD